MRSLAGERRRFGYRRLHWLLGREGLAMNHKKFRRLYREERLQVRRRGGRKRALGTRAPTAIPQGRNQRWSLDFVSDAFACGRRFRMARGKMSSPIIDKIMNEQDRDFIRVLEDLIDVLVARGVITMDMLPKDARDKLATRRQMRDTLREPAVGAQSDISAIDRKLAALRFKD